MAGQIKIDGKWIDVASSNQARNIISRENELKRIEQQIIQKEQQQLQDQKNKYNNKVKDLEEDIKKYKEKYKDSEGSRRDKYKAKYKGAKEELKVFKAEYNSALKQSKYINVDAISSYASDVGREEYKYRKSKYQNNFTATPKQTKVDTSKNYSINASLDWSGNIETRQYKQGNLEYTEIENRKTGVKKRYEKKIDWNNLSTKDRQDLNNKFTKSEVKGVKELQSKKEKIQTKKEQLMNSNVVITTKDGKKWDVSAGLREDEARKKAYILRNDLEKGKDLKELEKISNNMDKYSFDLNDKGEVVKSYIKEGNNRKEVDINKAILDYNTLADSLAKKGNDYNEKVKEYNLQENLALSYKNERQKKAFEDKYSKWNDGTFWEKTKLFASEYGKELADTNRALYRPDEVVKNWDTYTPIQKFNRGAWFTAGTIGGGVAAKGAGSAVGFVAGKGAQYVPKTAQGISTFYNANKRKIALGATGLYGYSEYNKYQDRAEQGFTTKENLATAGLTIGRDVYVFGKLGQGMSRGYSSGEVYKTPKFDLKINEMSKKAKELKNSIVYRKEIKKLKSDFDEIAKYGMTKADQKKLWIQKDALKQNILAEEKGFKEHLKQLKSNYNKEVESLKQTGAWKNKDTQKFINEMYNNQINAAEQTYKSRLSTLKNKKEFLNSKQNLNNVKKKSQKRFQEQKQQTEKQIQIQKQKPKGKEITLPKIKVKKPKNFWDKVLYSKPQRDLRIKQIESIKNRYNTQKSNKIDQLKRAEIKQKKIVESIQQPKTSQTPKTSSKNFQGTKLNPKLVATGKGVRGAPLKAGWGSPKGSARGWNKKVSSNMYAKDGNYVYDWYKRLKGKKRYSKGQLMTLYRKYGYLRS